MRLAWTVYLAVILLAGALCASARAQATTIAAEAPQGTRVSVHADQLPLRTVLEQLSTQVGIHITPDQLLDNLAPVTLDVQDKPLWETLEAVLVQAGKNQPFAWNMADTRSSAFPGGGTPTFHVAGVVSAHGPFLVVASRISREVDFRRPDADIIHCNIALQVYADPSVQLVGMATSAVVRRAVDEDGGALDVLNPTPAGGPGAAAIVQRTLPMNRPSPLLPQMCQVQIRPSATNGRKIQVLEGSVAATVAGKIESLELVVPGRVEKDTALGHVTFSAEAAADGTWTLSAALDRPATQQPEQWINQRMQFMGARLSLLDAAGKRWVARSMSFPGTLDQLSLQATFARSMLETAPPAARAGDAVKATLELVTENRTVEIPFHFENLPYR